MNKQTSTDGTASILNDVHRIEAITRKKGRWSAWLWILTGLATAVFCVFAPPISHGWVKYVVTIAFPVFGLVALWYAWRQQVMSKAYQRNVAWVTSYYVGLVVADSVYRLTWKPNHLDMWVVLLGTLPAFPCIVGAWRMWRA